MNKIAIDNIDTYEIAENLYNYGTDMDGNDYDDNKDQTVKELEAALYNIKCIAQNEYNNDYWRTLLEALAFNFDTDNYCYWACKNSK